MDELIGRITDAVGIDAQTAQTAIGVILNFLNKEGPDDAMAQVLEATNGNLSVHLRKLEEAGYVRIEKGFEERRPITHVHLTEKGRTAWSTYLDALKPLFGG